MDGLPHRGPRGAAALPGPTGSSVAEAWERERALLTPLPETLPEPFDVVRDCRVGEDCLVNFEGRQYSVPFPFVQLVVEVRGLANHVQCLKGCQEVARHPRGTAARLVVDDAHYEGSSTERVVAPPPLGRMGRRLQELAAVQGGSGLRLSRDPESAAGFSGSGRHAMEGWSAVGAAKFGADGVVAGISGEEDGIGAEVGAEDDLVHSVDVSPRLLEPVVVSTCRVKDA